MYTVKFFACYEESSWYPKLRKFNRTMRCKTLLRAMRSGQRLAVGNDCGERIEIYDRAGDLVMTMDYHRYISRRGDEFRFGGSGTRAFCSRRGGMRPSVECK